MRKSTKMIMAFGAIISLSTSAFAQKACNLGVTMTSPTANQEIPFTTSSNHVYLKFSIKNNGTASIVPADTIFFNAGGIVSSVTGKTIAANQTELIESSTIYVNNTVTTQTTSNICITLLSQSDVFYISGNDTTFATVTYTDADSTNDKSCVSVILKPNPTPPTSVFEFGNKSTQQLNLYPNPANNELMFQLKLEKADKVTVSIKDVTGREVLRKDYGIIQAGMENTFNLDVKNINNGLYLVELISGENKTTGKVEIMH